MYADYVYESQSVCMDHELCLCGTMVTMHVCWYRPVLESTVVRRLSYHESTYAHAYGVATISRLLKIIGLFYRM